ncbi:MAG: hypothetical protein P8Y45_04330 [Exilibacterium sp.]
MDRKKLIEAACQRFENNPRRMLDILWEIQDALGCIDSEAMQQFCTEQLAAKRLAELGKEIAEMDGRTLHPAPTDVPAAPICLPVSNLS